MPPIIVPGGALRGPLFASLLRRNALAPALPPGMLVGAYRLDGVIGRGGSGVVYRAQRDDGAFAQTVALKIVRADPLQREHLRRERDILGQLHHPGIARIHDGGEIADGEPWYAMEYVDGRRIDRWCEERGAHWRERIRLLIAVCDAVIYAHARLVVHQDLKPSNVLVDAEGFPRLLDFGISRRVRDDGGRDETISFTPGMASPEQLAGAPTTTATDVFQLGRLAQLLLEPEHVDLWRGARLAQRNVRAVTARATATEQRYATVRELQADLQRVLAQRPAMARRWPLLQRLAFFSHRHAKLLALGGLALLSLTAATLHYTLLLRTERDRAAAEARETRIANEVLHNVFRAAPGAADAERMSTAQVLERAAITSLKRLDAASTQRDIAAASIAAAHLDLQAPQKARLVLDEALAQGADSGDEAQLQRARIRVLRARVAVQEKDFDAAQAQLAAAAATLDRRTDRALDSGMLQEVLVDLAERRGDTAQAQRLRDTLIATLQAQDLADDPLYARQLAARATQRSFANDYVGAKRDIDAAHAIVANHYGPSSPLALQLERQRVWLDMISGELSAADRRLETQRRTVLDSFGADSLEYAAVLQFQGNTEGERGDAAKQEASYVEAYRILRARLDPDALDLAAMAHNLGDLALERGDAASALPLYREALRIRRLTLPENNQPLLINRLQIARAQCDLGDRGEANAAYDAVRHDLASVMAAGHPYLAVAAAMHVDCLRRQGRTEEARRLFAQELPAALRAGLKGRSAERVERVRAALESPVAR